jgi:prepilin peptidase CpaA
LISSTVVLAAGLPAAWIDFRTHRIPNPLVAAALVGGCLVQFALHGSGAFGPVVGGTAVGLLGLLPLHLTGALGAGDVKLMAAFGALLGPSATVMALAFTLIAGAALAVAALGWRRWSAAAATPAEVANSGLVGQLPYAGAIVAGSLAATLIGS